MCGGTFAGGVGDDALVGLSPRVRGNLACAAAGAPQEGSIPACAGEPILPEVTLATPRVYPRVCGGTLAVRQPPVCIRGLSPRVRGNPRGWGFGNLVRGSIPACAGEPHSVPQGVPSPGVYPRVCGGTPHQAVVGALGNGLSPRVRGNPDHILTMVVGLGSIPACAGEPRVRVRWTIG